MGGPRLLRGATRAAASPADARMTLAEHLRELRTRLLRSLAAVVVTTGAAFAFHDRLLGWVSGPYCDLPARLRFSPDGGCQLFVTGVLEGFNVTLRVSLYAGLLAAAPVWLYQLWRFVTPGLYVRERRWAVGFVGSSLLLFAGGGALAWLTLTRGLAFLLGVAGSSVTTMLTVSSYVSFVTAMVLVFGVAFELPLLLVALNLAGVLPYTRLRAAWRGAVFGVFVFAALVTPSQDPITMTAMAVPMTLLYGAATAFARVHDRRAAARELASPYAGLADDDASPLGLGSV